MASERVEAVKMSFQGGRVELSSYNQDFGDAREEMDVVYEGPPFEIAFNSRYLMEALHAIDTEEVLMELKDEGSPGLIRPFSVEEVSRELSIVMPMRI